MDRDYEPPTLRNSAFNCPHCDAYAEHKWSNLVAGNWGMTLDEWAVGLCMRCGSRTVWLEKKLIYPSARAAPSPNADLPHEIANDYEEASSILGLSPRGSAALLRLCVQKLCRHLGEKGKNINDDIASLVRKGLPASVQQALDVVRVTGNEAVHPGQLDLSDDQETVGALFRLVNFITAKMISEPKEIEALYNGLPEAKRKEIERRDAAKGTPPTPP